MKDQSTSRGGEGYDFTSVMWYKLFSWSIHLKYFWECRLRAYFNQKYLQHAKYSPAEMPWWTWGTVPTNNFRCFFVALVGASMAIQWLRLSISNSRVWVWFPVRELRSHTPHSQKKRKKTKNMLNHITSLLKIVQCFSISYNIIQCLYSFLKAC